MAGTRKKPSRGGKYQGWFIDASGKQKFFTGARSKAETLRMAKRLEDEHRQVRLGYRPARSSADKHKARPVEEVCAEYMAWGEAQGGRGGRPWGATHARMRRSHLTFWRERLGIESLADLEGILPRVEGALRDLQTKGRAGKTVANYAEAMAAFCDWCEDRGYLDIDPLKALAAFDTTPITRRRALSGEEIGRLLASCAPHRRLLLETAFLSGLRVNELRSLTIDDVDMEECGLRLQAQWTKNRQEGFQPLPRSLVDRLLQHAQAGEPARCYARTYARRGAKLTAPKAPLLYVPTHPSRDLALDLEAAGIPKNAPGGKIDFHAARVAYINLVLESGVTVKEAQALARHSTPEMTMNVYGRTRKENLSDAVEQVAKAVETQEKYVPSMYRLAVGAEQESATPNNNKELRSPMTGGGGGNRTRVREQVLRDHYVRSQSMLRLSRPHQLRLTGSGSDQS